MSTTAAKDSPLHKMTVEEFLGWAMEQHSRHELIDGVLPPPRTLRYTK
jgi:hypothetical protein